MATMKRFEGEMFHKNYTQAASLWKLAEDFVNVRSAGVIPVEQWSIDAIQALAATKDEIARAIYNDPESWIVERHEHEPACQCEIDPNREEFACRSCQCAARTTELSEVF